MSTPRADLLVLDGRHLLWRCVHSYGDLGIELPGGGWLDTGAIYGFLLLAQKAHQRYGGLVVVAWEAETNFRLALYPNYKGRLDQAAKFKEMREAIARGEMPDVDRATRERFDLGSSIEEQQDHLHRLLKLCGVRQYLGTDCEADDVMATIAQGTAARNKRVVIYTGDSDLFQVVDENITVAKPGKGGDDDIFTAAEVAVKMGVRVDQVAAFKALAGDASDKIPGAPGIGKKAAVRLIERYDTLPGVLYAAENNDPGWPCSARQRQAVVDHIDNLRLYLRLTTVNTKANLNPRLLPEPDRKALMEAFRFYKFGSLTKPSDIRAMMAMGGIA